jgi:hypothetical protein
VNRVFIVPGYGQIQDAVDREAIIPVYGQFQFTDTAAPSDLATKPVMVQQAVNRAGTY